MRAALGAGLAGLVLGRARGLALAFLTLASLGVVGRLVASVGIHALVVTRRRFRKTAPALLRSLAAASEAGPGWFGAGRSGNGDKQ